MCTTKTEFWKQQDGEEKLQIKENPSEQQLIFSGNLMARGSWSNVLQTLKTMDANLCCSTQQTIWHSWRKKKFYFSMNTSRLKALMSTGSSYRETRSNAATDSWVKKGISITERKKKQTVTTETQSMISNVNNQKTRKMTAVNNFKY